MLRDSTNTWISTFKVFSLCYKNALWLSDVFDIKTLRFKYTTYINHNQNACKAVCAGFNINVLNSICVLYSFKTA